MTEARPKVHNNDNLKQRPELSVTQIWNMCFGFLGIQMGFALQNANVSRIFQSLGARIEDIPILWIAAPVTGLLVQPIVGYFSDRTWGRLGRRRPYFLFGAVAASIAILFMPHAPTLWIAAGTLWIMDASINVSMEPFRAFVGDNLPEHQRSTGFATQSFLIGIGAIAASALPWVLTNLFDVSNTAEPGAIPDTVRYAFYVGAVCLLATVSWTVLSSREYSPAQLRSFQSPRSTAEGRTRTGPTADQLYRQSILWTATGCAFTGIILTVEWEPQLYILSGCAVLFGSLTFWAAKQVKAGQSDRGLAEIVSHCFTMPDAMRRLAVVQFFSWFALFAMWIYATPAVTSYHFGSDDPSSIRYNNGADWVGILFAAYNGFAALAAIGIPSLVLIAGHRRTHAICLLSGALGLGSFFFLSPNGLLLSMFGVGIAWASILSMPYVILSVHLPNDKMGVFMGIFNCFIVLPQIIAASVLGTLLSVFFEGEPIYAMGIAAASLLVAALSLLLLEDTASATTAAKIATHA